MPRGFPMVILSLLMLIPLAYFVTRMVRRSFDFKVLTVEEVDNFTIWMNKLKMKQDDPVLVKFIR